MATHRPHPITGPWPYVLHPRDEVSRYDGYHGPSLVDRIPADDSRIYADPDDALLFDGCERCEQHASHPMSSVDDEKVGKLWLRMVEVERDETYQAVYRTNVEATACRRLYECATLIARTHPGIDPWRWPWTFRVEDADVDVGFPLDQPWYLDQPGYLAGADEEG
jgi:hypothetical protein